MNNGFSPSRRAWNRVMTVLVWASAVLVMILVAGIIMEKGKRNLLVTILGMLVGVAIDYAVGTAWFVFQTESTVVHALDVCVYPFIPFDVAKIVIAVLLGSVVYKGLQRAKLL